MKHQLRVFSSGRTNGEPPQRSPDADAPDLAGLRDQLSLIVDQMLDILDTGEPAAKPKRERRDELEPMSRGHGLKMPGIVKRVQADSARKATEATQTAGSKNRYYPSTPSDADSLGLPRGVTQRRKGE